MISDLPPVGSYWNISAPIPRYDNPLPKEIDVVVVGGGITGITTAYLLKQEGYSVLLLEANTIASLTSGRTTAKVTAQHGIIYAHLYHTMGSEAARLYGEAQSFARDWINEARTRLDIDCLWRPGDSFVYTNDFDYIPALEEETHYASLVGQPAELVTETRFFPFQNSVAAEVFHNQASFHPVMWLRGLAALIPDGTSTIVEGIRALSIEEGSPHILHTERGEVRAKHIVIASHSPFYDPEGTYVTRMYPMRDLVVAGFIPKYKSFEGMYLAEPHFGSARTVLTDDVDKVLLIVLGEQFRSGTVSDINERYEKLAEWAMWKFPYLTNIDYRWAAHDNITVDRLPFIGKHSVDNLWIATGFNQWGMTNGTLAAHIIKDLIKGHINPETRRWAQLLDSRRAVDLETFPQFTEDLSKVDKSTVLIGACTHYGCTVHLNDSENSWDCPCHGSRYTHDGAVIQGPTVKPLAKPIN